MLIVIMIPILLSRHVPLHLLHNVRVHDYVRHPPVLELQHCMFQDFTGCFSIETCVDPFISVPFFMEPPLMESM